MRDSIAKRLRDLRVAQRLTQKQVAEELCLSQSAYSFIESGTRGLAVEHVIKLSKLYNTSTDFILIGKN